MKRNVLLILSIILIVGIISAFANADKWLIVKDKPQISDVIIRLGGDGYYKRDQKVIELYKKGYSSLIILSTGQASNPSINYRTNYSMGLMIKAGIPQRNIIIQYGDEADLTDEEKQFVEDVMETQREAAGYYKGIKGMKPMWETVLPKARKNIADREAPSVTQEPAFAVE